MHTKEELKMLQNLPLSIKIKMTQRRIRDWYDYWGGQVYVSFSGGKDSTVLLDIARDIYPDIEAVFVDTGLEYPEIREFVKTKENVTWLKPKMNFKEVINHYGYPVVSKEQSEYIREYRTAKSEKTKQLRINGNKWGRGKISDKWQYLIDAPFKIDDRCCAVMKKRPAKSFEKETKKKPLLALMAAESKKRETGWLKTGCNAFEKNRPQSQPMAFWTEQDVLQYILDNNLPYASVYGDIVKDYGGEVEGQMELKDFGLTEQSKYTLTTTGVKRTGCMFCMFGAHLEKEPNRFQQMKITHPKQYNYCMKPVEEGGLGLAKVLDYIKVKY